MGDVSKQNTLEESFNFTIIEPQLQLGLGKNVKLLMGATFGLKKSKNKNGIIGAKLWDINGAYGNSLFAGLKISI